jgi:hypothetical protein
MPFGGAGLPLGFSPLYFNFDFIMEFFFGQKAALVLFATGKMVERPSQVT